MRSKLKFAGITSVVLLVATTPVAALLEVWWLALTAIALLVAAATFLAGAAYLSAVDSGRRLRKFSAATKREVHKELGAAGASYVETLRNLEELTTSSRILHAKYIGRLDRLQGALDQAIRTQETNPNDRSDPPPHE